MYNLKDESFLRQVVEMVESSENCQRVEKHTRAYKIVNGNQREIVEDELRRKYPESFDEMTSMALGIGEKIIRKLSRCYAAGCTREVINKKTGVVDEEMTALMSDVYSTISDTDEDMNTVMSRVNELYSNHKYVEMFTYVNDDYQIKIKPLPQQLFTALPNKTKTKSEVMAFKQDRSSYWNYERFIDWNTVDPLFKEEHELVGIYTLWSKEENFTFVKMSAMKKNKSLADDSDEVVFTFAILQPEANKDGKNPWDVYPFVGVKAATDGQFYPYGNEIAETSKDINIIFSDIISIAAAQGFGQAVLYYDGEKVPQINKSGPTHVISIPNQGGKAKFEFANANPDLEGHLGIALSIVRILLTTNDLTTDKVSGELAATNFASAIDRLIADSETIENIEDQRKKYTIAERKAFKIIQKELKYLKSIDKWPETYKDIASSKLEFKDYILRLKFNTIKPLTTEKEKATTIVYLDDNGFILPHEKHMMFSEGMTEKEAEERESKIKESKAEESKDALENQLGKVADANSQTNEEDQSTEPSGSQRGNEKKPQAPVGK